LASQLLPRRLRRAELGSLFSLEVLEEPLWQGEEVRLVYVKVPERLQETQIALHPSTHLSYEWILLKRKENFFKKDKCICSKEVIYWCICWSSNIF
jgi:hypothetical protein